MIELKITLLAGVGLPFRFRKVAGESQLPVAQKDDEIPAVGCLQPQRFKRPELMIPKTALFVYSDVI